MNDTSPTLAPAPPASRGRGLLVLFLLVALALSAALAYGGWWVWQQLDTNQQVQAGKDAALEQLSQKVQLLTAGQAELKRAAEAATEAQQGASAALVQLQLQQQTAQQTVETLENQIKGGRAQFQLAAIEELLMTAQDRVALAHDAEGAVVALELADQRLAALADARLLPVRQALSAERLALLAQPHADVVGAALALSGLLDTATTMPLRGRMPTGPAAEAAPTPAPDEATTATFAEWPERLWAGTKEALSAVFHIRQESHPVERLLPPEQESLIHTVLMLKLEGARLALLRRDTASFQSLLSGAQTWLEQYYIGSDSRVAAARSELERLRGLELDPELPVPQKALTRLRAVSR